MKKAMMFVLLAAFLSWSPVARAGRGMIQIKGSDTLINLVQRLAEVYMEGHPGKYIAVTGGGSGTGIAALINGKCDIADASRVMKPKEEARVAKSGRQVHRVVIAMDGLSVIVNAANPVDRLTMDQVGAIFRGDITNWKDVGGPEMPITLYGRQSNSGTFIFFRDTVLKGDYSQKMNRMNGNAQIVESVKKDRTGIGYVGVGYVKEATGLKVLKIASHPGGNYADPLNKEDVEKGIYPITRPLNQYIGGQVSPEARAFIEFELSPKGQAIVQQEGFFPVSAEYKALNRRAGF